MWIPSRSDSPELLDADNPDHHDLVVNLADMALANRFLGTAKHLIAEMERLLRGHRDTDPLCWLDVGTGDASIPLTVTSWAGWRRKGIQLVISDLKWDVLAIARENLKSRNSAAITHTLVIQHDASGIPLADSSVDIVSCCNTLHHLGHDQAIAFLREAERVSRLGFVIIDLRRSLFTYLVARLLVTVAGAGHRLSRHDAPLSILKSFTRAELAGLARAAGVHSAKTRDYAWQMALVRDKKADTLAGT